jgi:hypothetical protein
LSNPRVTVITVETPDEDPQTVTFDHDTLVESISVSEYPFSRYNTEGVELAASALTGWLAVVRDHDDARVRDWFAKLIDDNLANGKHRYEFRIDPKVEVVTGYRDLDKDYSGVIAGGGGDWTVEDDLLVRAASEAQMNSIYAFSDACRVLLKLAVLAEHPDATGIVLDINGESSMSALYVKHPLGDIEVDSLRHAETVRDAAFALGDQVGLIHDGTYLLPFTFDDNVVVGPDNPFKEGSL